jgi:hypothetical protein
MDAQTKAIILHDVIRRRSATGGGDITTADWLAFVEAQNDGYRTGPAIGEPVPDFTLPDQEGKLWTQQELMGPNGLLLVFSRSAGW